MATPQRRLRIVLAIAVYGVLAVIAVLWGALRDGPHVLSHPDPWIEFSPAVSLATSITGGILLGFLVIALTQLLVRRTAWARRLHTEFRSVLSPLTGAEIFLYAACSALGEELFFRGALQPALGIAAASLLFGVVHVPPSRQMWTWTLFAFVMGLMMGLLFELTGNLVGPVVAHFLINYENLHFIESHDPASSHARPFAKADRLVSPLRRRG